MSVEELPVPLRVASFDEWWTRTCALSGPLARIVASLSEDAGQALRARAREAVRPYENEGGLELPGVTLVAGARRA